MNIPARYCTGYLGDIGVPPEGPMDFAAWFEAFLDGHWYTFDPRKRGGNESRAGVHMDVTISGDRCEMRAATIPPRGRFRRHA